MFRILLIIGLLFASASQGFAHKVKLSVDESSVPTTLNSLSAELVAPECCKDQVAVPAKPSHCKSDCKGVIADVSAVPFKTTRALDGVPISFTRSVTDLLEPGPPKS